MNFDFDFDKKSIDIETTMQWAIAITFTGGAAKTSESPNLADIKKLLKIKDIDHQKFYKLAPWNYSSDRMAYNTPWYTYDKRFAYSNHYRSFVFAMRKFFGIKLASLFFTKDFQTIVTPENLDAIDKVYFNNWYLQWT